MAGPKTLTVAPAAPLVQQLVRTWVAGLVALLPLALTLMALGWAGRLIFDLVGPGSLVGRFFVAIGHPLSGHVGLAYLIGTLTLVAAIYVLGRPRPVGPSRAAAHPGGPDA